MKFVKGSYKKIFYLVRNHPITKKIESWGGGNHLPGYFFFFIVAGIHLILLFFEPSLFIKSILSFSRILFESIPALMLVYVSFVIANLFIHPENVVKHLGEGSKYKKWIIAIMSGLISMGPSYMWYPVMGDLKKKGTTNGFIVTFLSNKAINVALIPTFVLFFGIKYVTIFIILMISFSVLQGILFDYLEKQSSFDKSSKKEDNLQTN